MTDMNSYTIDYVLEGTRPPIERTMPRFEVGAVFNNINRDRLQRDASELAGTTQILYDFLLRQLGDLMRVQFVANNETGDIGLTFYFVNNGPFPDEVYLFKDDDKEEDSSAVLSRIKVEGEDGALVDLLTVKPKDTSQMIDLYSLDAVYEQFSRSGRYPEGFSPELYHRMLFDAARAYCFAGFAAREVDRLRLPFFRESRALAMLDRLSSDVIIGEVYTQKKLHPWRTRLERPF